MTTVAHDPDRALLLAELQAAVDALDAAEAAQVAAQDAYTRAGEARSRRAADVRMALLRCGLERVVIRDRLVTLKRVCPVGDPLVQIDDVEVVS